MIVMLDDDNLALVGHQVELDVLLPLEDGDALEDRGAEESQVGQVTLPASVIRPKALPTPERLRPVGGSKSLLQLELETPQTAGMEALSLKVVTACSPSSVPLSGSMT